MRRGYAIGLLFSAARGGAIDAAWERPARSAKRRASHRIREGVEETGKYARETGRRAR